MSLGINVEEDGLYLKGLQTGREELAHQRDKWVKSFLSEGVLTEQQIADHFNLPLEYVRNLRSNT